MKKVYQKPAIEVMAMDTESDLLAASGNDVISIDNDIVMDDDIYVGSKRPSFNVWGDDDE